MQTRLLPKCDSETSCRLSHFGYRINIAARPSKTQSRFLLLLGALILFLLIGPLVDVDWHGVNIPHVFAAVVYVCAVAAATRKWTFLGVAIGIAVASVALGGQLSVPIRTVGVLLDVALLLYTGTVIVLFVFRGSTVDGETLLAAVCLYLLIGLTFARIYFLCTLTISQDAITNLQAFAHTMPEFTYFSMTTLSTVGYGDMHPNIPIVRSLALVEGITGQLYLVVLIGRLVGMHITQSHKRS